DGLCSSEGLSAWITKPSGQKEGQSLIPGEGLYYVLYFSAKEIGYYDFVVKKEAVYSIDAEGKYMAGSKKENPEAVQGIAYTQYSRCLVRVGNTEKEIPSGTHCNLCISQLAHYNYQAGNELQVELSFKDEVLPGVEVIIAGEGPEGSFSETKITDSQGILNITPVSTGQHILIARHVDEDDKKEGEYDKRNYTSVFSFTVN
ncbi:MAG: DUF4198 domain-containing protein, partial [Candidatus Contubernalis sp.]|nr:DUF4198 domain-containing protein [Candidatus Contubernalis sp.]